MGKIKALDREVRFYKYDKDDYICLTDIAKYKDAKSDDIIKNWLRNRNTIEFLGIWESINNPDFKPVEFDGFRKKAGLNIEFYNPGGLARDINAKNIMSKQFSRNPIIAKALSKVK